VIKKKNNSKLNNLIIQDCLMFDRTKTTLNDHFIKRMDLVPTENVICSPTKNVLCPEEMNTSRYLQEGENPVKEKPNNLALKDNNFNDVENVENKTVENTEKNEKDIEIHNNFVRANASIEIDPKNQQVANQTNITTTLNLITMRDYESLTLEERLVYDTRSFSVYFKQNLVRTNLIFSIIFKESIIDPIHIRLAKLIFSVSLIFGTNAFLFSDYYVEQRMAGGNKVYIY
jgi:hypothetical protein